MEVEVSKASENMLAEAMVGRSFKMPIRKEVPAGESLLDFDKVSVSGPHRLPVLEQVSFSVHAREVGGLAGISGNGQRVLADLISGLQSPTSGQVSLYGQPLKRFHPREMLRQGVGRIPEDRHGFGVVGDLTSLKMSFRRFIKIRITAKWDSSISKTDNNLRTKWFRNLTSGESKTMHRLDCFPGETCKNSFSAVSFYRIPN